MLSQTTTPVGATAVGRRVDANDVDLAGRAAVHLRPVEADQAAIPLGQEEPGRIEPAFLLTQAEVGPGPCALLGMMGERQGVDPQPLAFVAPWDEGPDTDVRGHGRLRQRVPQGPPHLPERPDALQPRGSRQSRRGRQIAVGPHAQWLFPGPASERGDQRAAVAPPPPGRVDHQFTGGAVGGRLQIGVAGNVPLRCRRQVRAALAAVPQVERDVLG